MQAAMLRSEGQIVAHQIPMAHTPNANLSARLLQARTRSSKFSINVTSFLIKKVIHINVKNFTYS